MDYEKKYKEALERAKLSRQQLLDVGEEATEIEHIFPELKGSDDEKRMIKNIKIALMSMKDNLTNFYSTHHTSQEELLAWLEKQGEKTNPYSGASFEYNGHTWGMCARDNGVDISLDEQLFKHLDEKENNNSFFSEEMNKSIWRGIAISLIKYLDDNRYEGAMNMSNMECEDLEKSIIDSDWGKVYRYMKKKLERQCGTSPTTSNPTVSFSDGYEKRIENVISVLDAQMCWDGATGKKMNPYQNEIDWLKSLKSNLKPSDTSVKEIAHQIAWETSKHYDPNACKQEWCEMAALDMASRLEKQELIAKWWRKNDKNNKPPVKHSVLMLTTHGVAEGEWLGNGWCQYRWSCKIEDEDVLYWLHLSDLETPERCKSFNHDISSWDVSNIPSIR